MTTEELIARLEAATGPCRELDAEIYEFHVGLKQYESVVRDGPDIFIRYYPGPPGPDYYRVPRYTASIDAALTLMPNNYDCLVCRVNGKWQATCGPENSFQDVGDQKGATPAIALCIAALKARAAT